MEVPGEREPGELRDRLRVGGKVPSLHNGVQPRLQRDQVLRARRKRRRADLRVRGRRARIDVCERVESRAVVGRLDQRPAQIEVGRRKAGFESNGFPEFGDRFVEAAGALEGVGERLVRDRQPGEPTNRFLLLLDRRAPVTPVGAYDPDLVANSPIIRLQTSCVGELGNPPRAAHRT